MDPATVFIDHRGSLRVLDQSDLPFDVKRVFWVYNMPAEFRRGNHSHKKCQQYIIALSGSIRVLVDKQLHILTVGTGAFVDAGQCVTYWNTDGWETGAVVVLCSEPYDEKDVYQCA